MNDKMSVGFVGLGLMGNALAHRLIEANHSVIGFDVDENKRKAFRSIGAISASSLADIAAHGTPIILSVFDTDQVEDVLNALAGLLGSRSGKIIICTSTCDPERLTDIGIRAAEHGLRLVEAPISGTSDQVLRGRGVGLIGGDVAAIDEVKEILDVLFQRRFYLGQIGNAGRAKLAINLILGLNRLALAEGLVFAERMGLDPEAFLNVARGAASYSQVMDTKGPKMVRGDFTPEGRVKQTLKDFHLMLDQARKLEQQLPLAALNVQMLEACVRNGEGEQDNSIVIQEIRRRAAVSLKSNSSPPAFTESRDHYGER